MHSRNCMLAEKLCCLDPSLSTDPIESKSARRRQRRCSLSVRIDRPDSDAASFHAGAGLMHQRRLLQNKTRALTVRPLNSHSFGFPPNPLMVAFGQPPPRITKLWTWLVGGGTNEV